MSVRRICVVVVVLFLSLIYGKTSQGLVVPDDNFDVTYSSVASPISDVYFFRVYTDATGLPAVQLTAAGDIGATDGVLNGLLLPAVTNPLNPAYGLIGQTGGIIVVAMGDGSADTAIGNDSFDFTSTFGISERELLPAVQNGQTSALIGLLDQAYDGALLPALNGPGNPSPGTLVAFDAPALQGNITVTQSVPEPATFGVLGLLALAGQRKRIG